jgi:hypothetical protein
VQQTRPEFGRGWLAKRQIKLYKELAKASKMNAVVLLLRVCLVFFGLVIYPTQLYYLELEEAERQTSVYNAYALGEGPVVRRERIMVYLYSTSNFLWLVYGLVINEWVITFTSTFNLCLLSALISAKNRLRRAALYHCNAKGAYQGVAVLTHANVPLT